MYVVSLASNEKFELHYEEIVKLRTTTLTVLVLVTAASFFSISYDSAICNLYDQTIIIFSQEIRILIVLIISYLLFTLIVAVKISSKYEGPLRNFI